MPKFMELQEKVKTREFEIMELKSCLEQSNSAGSNSSDMHMVILNICLGLVDWLFYIQSII